MNREALILSSVLSVVLGLCPVEAQAAFEEWAIGLKSGTLGIGGELTTNLAPRLNLRGSINWFEFDYETEIDDIDYELDLEFFNPLLVIDWYPFDTGFRVSGGVLFNGSDIALEGTSNVPIQIGGNIYVPADYGSIRGESDFDDIAPYVGLGFGNALTRDGRLGFTADIGVAFIGSPNVDLEVTNPLIDQALRMDLEQEEAQIEDELDKWRFYPVFSASLYYRF